MNMVSHLTIEYSYSIIVVYESIVKIDEHLITMKYRRCNETVL